MKFMMIGAVVLFAACWISVRTAAQEASGGGRWIDPRCAPLEVTKFGPFVQSEDGSLLTIDKDVLRSSADGGKTWVAVSEPIAPGVHFGWGGHVAQFLRARGGAIVIAYLDMTGYRFDWDDEKHAPKETCKLELWAIRSTDGGKTWTDKQRLLDGYNADFMGFIQTRGGRLVLTCEHLAPELRRWVCCSFVSDDDGKTWKQSNWIDLGGLGHHDGAVEPAVAELSGGRLMMFIRTNLDRLWSAYSDDQGRYWRVIQPTAIDASSAPCWVTRLHSGRLALAWNRLNPEGQTASRSASGGQASEFPASWHRGELSIAFSEDDRKTWTKPVVIAREPGASLAYPYLFERKPGELWVFTYYTFDAQHKPAPPLAVRLNEADFVSPEKR